MTGEDRIDASGTASKEKTRELPKILVVDDSEDNLRLFSTVLKKQGYRVTTAVNGEDALQKLHGEPPDLILSDVLMPVMDGFRLLQGCKADPELADTRFVLITGAFTDEKDEELGFELGADAFLRKPIDPASLVSALAELLSKPAAKKRGRKPQEDNGSPESGPYHAAIMHKLEQKMNALEEELHERKKAEEALVKSDQQYRLLFETMDQGVMYWSGGRVVSFNPAAARILGLEPDNLPGLATGDPVWRSFHEDGSDFAADDFPVTVAEETGRPVRDVTMGFFSSTDERFHWIRMSAIPQFHPAEDRPYQVYATFDDITDRFLAFKALQESESRISAILENTPDAIWSVDRDYHLTAANNSARMLYNQIYGATLMVGMDVRSAIPRENKDFWKGIEQHVFNGERVKFERHFERADGPLDLEFSLSPIISSSGRITGLSCFARDIREHLQSEARAKIRRDLALSLMGITDLETASRLCLDAAIDMAAFDSGVIYVLDDETGDLRTVYHRGVSHSIAENLSVLPAGSKWARLILKGSPFYIRAEEFTPPFDEQLRPEGFTFHATIPVQHGNRVIASLGVYSHVKTVMPGEVRNSLEAIAADIGIVIERMRARQDLRSSQEHYRSLFQHNPNAVYSLDLQGRFTSINAAAATLSGYSEEEALKMSFQQVVAPEYKDKVRLNFARASGGEPQAYESGLVAKDGSIIDIFITSTPIIIDGRVTGIYGIAEDITGRKKAAQDLRVALEQAGSILEGTIEAIVLMSELRDPYTSGHQRMVSKLAVAIATEIGLQEERVRELAVAGLLHDVGKVYVPSEILSKPGKLTSLELGLVKAHAEASYNIVRSIKFSGPMANIVWQHHERMDGSGYPQGLNGDQIMLEARILAVADVVEAMTAHRPYRPALGLEKALDEITRNRATLYDAQAVDACLVLFNDKGFQFQV